MLLAACRMPTQPTIQTERLILRPFTLSDAGQVQNLAGDRDIASTTINIPHPYEDGMAETWISTHQKAFVAGEGVNFGITSRENPALVGSIGLKICREHERAELGYWIGKPFWRLGFCTEAGRAVLQYGFDTLGLNRIHACYVTRNPASGRVMRKLGMTFEGCNRQHEIKWGQFEDLDTYAILASEWRQARASGSDSAYRILTRNPEP